jgi:hypothetical protein
MVGNPNPLAHILTGAMPLAYRRFEGRKYVAPLTDRERKSNAGGGWRQKKPAGLSDSSRRTPPPDTGFW